MPSISIHYFQAKVSTIADAFHALMRAAYLRVWLMWVRLRGNYAEAMLEAVESDNLFVVQGLLTIPGIKNNAHTSAFTDRFHGRNYFLNWAIKKGHLYIVRDLLTIQAVRDNLHINDYFTVFLAAERGDLLILRELLSISGMINNSRACGNVFLAAVTRGHLPVVQELLKIEAVRNAVAHEHFFLSSALHEGHLPVVQELLKIEAVRNAVHDVAHKDLFLYGAINGGHFHVIYAFVKTIFPEGFNSIPAYVKPTVQPLLKEAVGIKMSLIREFHKFRAVSPTYRSAMLSNLDVATSLPLWMLPNELIANVLQFLQPVENKTRNPIVLMFKHYVANECGNHELAEIAVESAESVLARENPHNLHMATLLSG